MGYFTTLHMKQLNSYKTLFPPFDKILVIQPIAKVYGESNERQLCYEIAHIYDQTPSCGISDLSDPKVVDP